ncbi:MAG: hypothetical protein J6B11_02305 [Spirochaetales bacterium]|nr:hypothetical protein [Spirochaetales bacterium]
MAVNPLDLQTNFMQINSISKKEVLSKEQEILKQEYVTDLLKKESEKNTEDVREAKDIDNLEHTNDRNKNKKDSEHKNKNAETEEANESETVAKTVLREDGVGIKIDTVG